MARYVRVRLANGDTRHATLSQDERTRNGQRESSAPSRLRPDGRGDLVAQALIVELSLVELDEQPKLDGVLPARAASTGVLDASEHGRARGYLSETLGDEPDHALRAARPG